MENMQTLETGKPCPCGGTFTRYVWPKSDGTKDFWICDSPAGPGKCMAAGKTYEEALARREAWLEKHDNTPDPEPSREALPGWPEPAETRPCYCGGRMLGFRDGTIFKGATLRGEMWVCEASWYRGDGCGALGDTYEAALRSRIPADRLLQ
jgi:hypothetical protein